MWIEINISSIHKNQMYFNLDERNTNFEIDHSVLNHQFLIWRGDLALGKVFAHYNLNSICQLQHELLKKL